MSQAPEHLKPAVAELLELPDSERIARIRSPRWIGYPLAKRILAELEDLIDHHESHRMPNLLIAGDTNNGKTMLVQRFCDRHPADDNRAGQGAIVPVLYIQAPPVPDESRFYSIILDRLFAPHKPSDRVAKKEFQAVKLLRFVGLRMLIIDEIHHILAGSMVRQKAFLNVIKYLGNELRVPIVGVGTKDAFRAIQTDAQLANRFEPAFLPRWKFDKTFLRLLASFECMLPLKRASGLCETDLATRLFSMSEGYIGEISTLLTKAAVQAVRTGRERIDRATLKELAWTAPSERRREPQGV